jgi:hypothetical protein
VNNYPLPTKGLIFITVTCPWHQKVLASHSRIRNLGPTISGITLDCRSSVCFETLRGEGYNRNSPLHSPYTQSSEHAFTTISNFSKFERVLARPADANLLASTSMKSPDPLERKSSFNPEAAAFSPITTVAQEAGEFTIAPGGTNFVSSASQVSAPVHRKLCRPARQQTY